jgi:radical SAM protein (TIGR01212 family)
MQIRYNNYSDFLKQRYGIKVYKLPIAIPVTCPNRDGICGRAGCTFCGDIGAGYQHISAEIGVKEQLDMHRGHIMDKYKAQKFIAYFQNNTNTNLELESLMTYVREACEKDVVRIALATRPDCVSDEYLMRLAELKLETGVDISIELGLQTANYHALQCINRGHSLAEYLDAMQRINRVGLESCTHVILNLPGSDRLDVIETAKILSVMKTTEAKLHALYIIKDTPMAKDYLAGQINLISLEEYIERVVLFLEYLDKGIVLQRLIGRAPESHTEFSNWGRKWWEIKARIEDVLAERGTYQGRLCDYIDGKALKKFK